jgi:hypothetical protein
MGIAAVAARAAAGEACWLSNKSEKKKEKEGSPLAAKSPCSDFLVLGQMMFIDVHFQGLAYRGWEGTCRIPRSSSGKTCKFSLAWILAGRSEFDLCVS